MSSSRTWFTGAAKPVTAGDPVASSSSRPRKRSRRISTSSDVEIVAIERIDEGNVPVEALFTPPPPVVAEPMAIDSPQRTGDLKPKATKSSGGVELSVFDILNIFRRRWFLSRPSLLANVISAQKAEDGNISWVEFAPQFHSHLVKCAVALVPHRLATVKKVMFVFILELLNGEGHTAFFELAKGGRKANNAQREKRRLARKRSRAAKRERVREAAKAAKLPARERQCLACGRKFESRKTARKHNCQRHSKVVRVQEKMDVDEQVSRTPKPTGRNKPPSTAIAPYVPPAPIDTNQAAGVTGLFRLVKYRYDGILLWANREGEPPVGDSRVRTFVSRRFQDERWDGKGLFRLDWPEFRAEMDPS